MRKNNRHATAFSWPRRVGILVLMVILLVGLGLLAYPTVSDLWNSYHQTQAIVTYAEQTSDMDEETRTALWTAAQEYNAALVQNGQNWVLSEEEQAGYQKQLSITAKGAMGYVEIPCIGVSLPIYHGTSEAVLQEGIGHLEGSSLPVGGESTHVVVSGHRGLPSAELFTNLDKMQKGDIFYLHVLGEILAYEVDQILTVEPDELEALAIQQGQDLCTLFTCTPYGINSHRLLVRGHRVDVQSQIAGGKTEAPTMNPKVDNTIFAALIILAVLLLLITVMILCVRSYRRTRRYKRNAAHANNMERRNLYRQKRK